MTAEDGDSFVREDDCAGKVTWSVIQIPQLVNVAAICESDCVRYPGQANARFEAAARRVGTAPEIVDIAQLDRRPVGKKLSPPSYPVEMATEDIPGEAVVEFVIGVDGSVVEARIVRSSRKEFEAPALAAVKKWKFTPGQIGNRAVGTRVSQVIKFMSAGEGPVDWF